jgi:hypothetical protein
MIPLTLIPLPDKLVVAQLPRSAPLPLDLVSNSGLTALIVTPEETTLVCAEKDVPPDARVETDWRALKVSEVLDFALIGILANISTILATAGVSIFVISTFNTDYILVKETQLLPAIQSLRQAGYTVLETSRQ